MDKISGKKLPGEVGAVPPLPAGAPIAATDTSVAALNSHLRPITVSVHGASKISGLSRAFLYNEMAAGRLSYILRGRRRLIRVDVLDAYLRDEAKPERSPDTS